MSPRLLLLVAFQFLAMGCASLPSEQHDRFRFPEEKVYVEEPTGKDLGRPYQPMGWVRAKATWPTMDQEANDPKLCRNYYNKASRSLLKDAQKAGADAVIKVRSVVLLLDGKVEEYAQPECSDDGAEGEILLRGIAIKFKKLQKDLNKTQ